jgi:hypothetical protein
MSKPVAIVVGVLIAALATFIALVLAGAGHGWFAPLRYSILVFGAYPVTLFRTANRPSNSAAGDIVLLVFGAAASLVLYLDVRVNEPIYFWKAVDIGLPSLLIWLLLWFGWQFVTIANLVRGRRSGQGN